MTGVPEVRASKTLSKAPRKRSPLPFSQRRPCRLLHFPKTLTFAIESPFTIYIQRPISHVQVPNRHASGARLPVKPHLCTSSVPIAFDLSRPLLPANSHLCDPHGPPAADAAPRPEGFCRPRRCRAPASTHHCVKKELLNLPKRLTFPGLGAPIPAGHEKNSEVPNCLTFARLLCSHHRGRGRGKRHLSSNDSRKSSP